MTPSRSMRNKRSDNHREDSVGSMDGKHTPLSSSPATGRAVPESSIEHRDANRDQLVLPDEGYGVENDETTLKKDELISNSKSANDNLEDEAVKKQKVSSHIEQSVILELDDGEDSKTARSSDNSRARSGSSRDYQKWRDGVEEEVIQRRSARMGSVPRHLDEKEHGFRRKNRDSRQELERNRLVAKGREESYPYREYDPGLAHHLHMKTDGLERRKERDNPDGSWQRRDDDSYSSRRIRPEETRKREHGDEMGSRHRSKVRESERGDKDEVLHSRKQLDNGSYRVYYDKDVGVRNRERDDGKVRYEHIDGKRRKDEEHLRREHMDKEDLHGHRENISRRKRERDEVLDMRKREEQQRPRDNIEDHHSVRHKDEGRLQRERSDRQREREEWHRLKQSHEENVPKRERDEGRVVVRSGRGADDKAWINHAKTKDESKASEKDYHHKETMRQGEPSKRRDRTEDENSHHGGREDVYPRGNHVSNEERRSRQDRSSIRNERAVNASDDHKMHDRKHKENTRRNKESVGGDNSSLVSSKRNQEDHSGQSNELVCSLLKRKNIGL